MPRRSLRLIVPAVAILVSAPAAHADEIKTVTGGSVSSTSRDSANAVLIGDGLFLSTHFTEGTSGSFSECPCAPGASVHLEGSWGGDMANLDHTVVKLDGHDAMNVALSGDFTLDGGNVVLPETSGSLLVAQRPFSLVHSFLIGFSDTARTIEAFRFAVTGTGIVTLTGRRINDSRFFDVTQMNWVFTNAQVAATPEPASALLLLTGVGIAAAVRRRRQRSLQLIVPTVVVLTLVALPARADEIKTITGGSVSTTSRTAADVVVVGDGLFLSGHFTDGVGSSLMCDPCAPGDTVHLRSAWGGDIPNVVVKLDGQEAMNVILAGFFELDGGDVVVPDTNGPLLVLQSHFSLTKGSSLFGFTDPSETHEAFRFNVTGSGIVTLTARRGIGDRPLYDRAQLNWVFTNAQVAATPEPASALLLLTGVGAAAAWRRQRRPT